VKKFKIIEFLGGTKARIYAVCQEDSEISDFEKFLTEYGDELPEEIGWLVDTIDKLANKVGIRDGFFKVQGIETIYRFINRKDHLAKTRVYCIKWGNEILILGGGAVKDFSMHNNSWQEHMELSRIVRPLAKIDQYLHKNNISIKEAADNQTLFEIE
jgi:hypothetical protein